MNIDFIKWLVGYSEGFEIIPKPFHEDNCECIEHKGVEHYDIDDLEDVAWWSNGFKHIIYPLLLQRTIEGLTKANIYYPEMYFNNNMACVDGDYRDEILKTFKHEFMDQAKEEALKYIWEKESL